MAASTSQRQCLIVGATGYVGLAISKRFVRAGWKVLGTARQPHGAALLRDAAVEPVVSPDGILDPSVAAAAAQCDVVIDVMRGSFKTRNKAAGAIINALRERGGIFIATTGTNFYGHTGGALAHEDWPFSPEPMTFSSWCHLSVNPLLWSSSCSVCHFTLRLTVLRAYLFMSHAVLVVLTVPHAVLSLFDVLNRGAAEKKTQHAINTWWQTYERTVINAAAVGVHSVIIRPSYVYGHGGGVAHAQLAAARERGAAMYIGNGNQRIGSVHLDDLADLYVLVAQQRHCYPPGSCFIGCSGLASRREVAEGAAAIVGCGCSSWTIAQAQSAVGMMVAESMARENATSGGKARQVLGWSPSRLGMVDDLLGRASKL